MVMVGRRKRRRQFGEKNSTVEVETDENMLDKVKIFGRQVLEKLGKKNNDSGEFLYETF
jgi:hypothetical protein